MSPRSRSPGSAADWLGRAKGKLALAESPLPEGGYLEDLCFCAQQAAELAVKAVYQQYGWLFQFTHDLGNLFDRLSEHGAALPVEVLDAERLSVYAVETRYPGLYVPVSKAEYDEAIRIATAVVRWAESIVT